MAKVIPFFMTEYFQLNVTKGKFMEKEELNTVDNNQDKSTRSIIEKAVIVFTLGYGLRYIARFFGARYYTWLNTSALDEGLSHIMLYMGHVFS